MNIEFMCELLANYSKELSEAETYREKGDVQLKHAKLILDKVKNCSIPVVVGRSEQEALQQADVRGSLPIFKCKCGYETSDSIGWCVHADCCSGNDR